ncbi:Adenylosuccinate lyase [Planctomycetales bacterium 10988]|nr:Adenylosuccinate lyase [Planctomycetales bacterium 10988]
MTEAANDQYQNPLIERYASKEMSSLWSPQRKFSTWRKLWVALAESEAELGLKIGQNQIDAMKANIENIDFEAAARHEKEKRHDVMAHVETFGEACPEAKGIIHLGATSCFVTDNTDLILLKEGLQMLVGRLAAVIDRLADFALRYKDLPCLGFTHLQPAQPTTVGKRASLWLYDFIMDLEEMEYRLAKLKCRGVKGTTGTQASFLRLFHGDAEKVEQLDQLVARKLGFAESFPVTGQTYSRKIDSQIMEVLSGVAQSAHKMGNDIRILQSRNELEEPFEIKQVGSSAMAYKRNPMRSERVCSLARFVMSLPQNTAATIATQWMERTLDDSANRRLVLPQGFLALDAILMICQNIASGLVVYPQVITKHLEEQMPFMATENFLMAAVEAGGDRQALHETIREQSLAAADKMKHTGSPNDLIERLQAEPAFWGIDFIGEMAPERFIGRAPEQVVALVEKYVEPIRARYPDATAEPIELRV